MLKITKDIEIEDFCNIPDAHTPDAHTPDAHTPDAHTQDIYMTDDEGNIICQYHKYHISINQYTIRC